MFFLTELHVSNFSRLKWPVLIFVAGIYHGAFAVELLDLLYTSRFTKTRRELKRLHSGKLTWQWKMDPLKMYFLLNMVILNCHLRWQEGNKKLGWNNSSGWSHISWLERNPTASFWESFSSFASWEGWYQDWNPWSFTQHHRIHGLFLVRTSLWDHSSRFMHWQSLVGCGCLGARDLDRTWLGWGWCKSHWQLSQEWWGIVGWLAETHH